MIERSRQRVLLLLLLIARLAPTSYAISAGPHLGYFEQPLHITAQHYKRDAAACPTSYSSCPASVNGGCCPTGLSCGISSCYPTTASTIQCSKTGYFACGIDQGGGCCPNGFTCAQNNCIPPAGASCSQDCGTASYLCPSSVGCGCCHNNLACGVNYCYATSFPTVLLTLTLTTTISDSITETITTIVQTAYTDQVYTSAATVSAVSKFTPSATAVQKVDATTVPASGGLTQAQLGGIIGAAAAVVIVVAVATFFILRRLNAVSREAKAAAAARYSGSGSNKKSSSRPHPHLATPSEFAEIVENMSVDPLMMSESGDDPSHSSVGLPRPSAVYSQTSDPQPASPPIPAPYGSPQAYAGGYQRVPMSEPRYSDISGHHRNHSDESQGHSRSPEMSGLGGYFDVNPALRDQNLWHGHPPSRPSVQTHGRQWSDSSDISQQSGSSGFAELDAGPDGDRRSSLQRALQGTGLARLGIRRPSLETRRRSTSSGAVRRDMGAAPGMSQRLENVVESEQDNRGKGKGVSTTETEASHARPPEQSADMAITARPPTDSELERRERQKVIGNLDNLRREP